MDHRVARRVSVRARWYRRIGWAALLSTALMIAILARGLWNAARDPIVRSGTVIVADWPADTPPLRILLLSDIHVAGPDMPPERLVQLVAGFNALRPDLVLIAGDLVSEKRFATRLYTPAQVVAPLGGLRARLGVVAALGNHDHWADAPAYVAALRAQNITVLQNAAVAHGPLLIGGVDDDFSRHDDVPGTFAAMDAISSAARSDTRLLTRILVTHSPDIVPDLPSPVAAVFAGHTHCGQIALPLIGPLTSVSRYGERFECGMINDRGQPVVVGAGLGTSILPLRYGTPPDVWLVTLRGPRA